MNNIILSLFIVWSFILHTASYAAERQIVTVLPGVDPEEVARELGVTPVHVYRYALNGFAAEIPESNAGILSRDERVLEVERDQAIELPQPVNMLQDGLPPATWGLDRINQRNLPLDERNGGTAATGKDVTIYIIDSGIHYRHDEFGKRASFGMDVAGGDGRDCEGHGSHVAGTAAGETYGVAPDAWLVSVAVFSCRGGGTLSDFIAGVDWVAGHRRLPAVANMSILSTASKAFDTAVQKMIDSGVVAVAAAGNNRNDACLFSPGRVPDVITVSGTDHDDKRISWMNYGTCVDVFAPGNLIMSAGIFSEKYVRRSGTSMAAPHVTGAAALYLENNPEATPREVRDALVEMSSRDVVKNSLSSAPHLLFVE